MKSFKISICCCSLLVALVLPAAAYPPKAGETCEATKTGVSHKIGDKNYKCNSTTCTSCDASGSQIGSCVKTTHYDNRVEAAAGGIIRNGPVLDGINKVYERPGKVGTPPRATTFSPVNAQYPDFAFCS